MNNMTSDTGLMKQMFCCWCVIEKQIISIRKQTYSMIVYAKQIEIMEKSI